MTLCKKGTQKGHEQSINLISLKGHIFCFWASCSFYHRKGSFLKRHHPSTFTISAFSKLQTSMSPSPPTAHFDTYSAVALAIHVTSGFEILKHQSDAAILNKTKPGQNNRLLQESSYIFSNSNIIIVSIMELISIVMFYNF